MRLNKYLIGLIYFLFLLVLDFPALADGAVPQPLQSLSYGPAKVELEGTLLVKDEYGPPNFGENPDSDQKLKIYVLHLSAPVDIKADAAPDSDDPDIDNYFNVKDIQVDFDYKATGIKSLINKKIKVSGSLHEKIAPGDYMDVVMIVDTVKPAT